MKKKVRAFLANSQQKRSCLYASTISCIDMIYILSFLLLSGVRLPSIQLSS